MPEQKNLSADNDYIELDQYLSDINKKKVMLVCGRSIDSLKINNYFKTLNQRLEIEVIRFSDFQSNPQYECVVKGVEIFRKTKCDALVAVGGGSAIDVAKCIKLYAYMVPGQNYLEQEIEPNEIPFIAVPTTAGTGSEATRFAVIYYNGAKQSVFDDSCLPNAVLLDYHVLESLPMYHRKSTMLDAFCHALEAFWSVNSDAESKRYSEQAIRIIMNNMDDYLLNGAKGNEQMLIAANLAGKAINIAQTTAAHAMCYKLTGLYGIAHGHAAALCLVKLWPFMLQNLHRCVEPRGRVYLESVFESIAQIMGCRCADEAADRFLKIFFSLGLEVPHPKQDDFESLRNTVNPVRLKNNPIGLDAEAIDLLYHQILA